MPFALHSPSFIAGGDIPTRHTCDGEDLSPPLAWSGLPDDARSLALIVDDPDAPDPARPRKTWVHWLAYNLPITTRELPEGAGNRAPHPPAAWALTDANSLGYQGPCPPVGRHRYFFRLFALDTLLPPLGPGARRADLERAMAQHIRDTAELMGTYQRAAGGRGGR